MAIPGELVLLTLPSLIYLAVQHRRMGKWHDLLIRLGWWGASVADYGWALVAAAGLGAAAVVAIHAVPTSVLHNHHVTNAAYAGWTRSLGSFLRAWWREAIDAALGEEIFFRGLLGGWLMRRFGFRWGNALQALLFLLPHLLLLAVSLSLWPLVLVQGVAGWVLGWLRYRSGSILPGWLTHSLLNAIGAFVVMR